MANRCKDVSLQRHVCSSGTALRFHCKRPSRSADSAATRYCASMMGGIAEAFYLFVHTLVDKAIHSGKAAHGIFAVINHHLRGSGPLIEKKEAFPFERIFWHIAIESFHQCAHGGADIVPIDGLSHHYKEFPHRIHCTLLFLF